MNSISGNIFNTRIYTGGGFSLHFHKSFELIYVKEGDMRCTVGRRYYELKKNDFLMILPYEIHSFAVTDGSRVSVTVFSESYVKSFSKLIKGKICDNAVFLCDEPVRRFYETELVDKFGDFFMEDPTENMTLIIKACLYAVLSECAKKVGFVDSARGGAELPERVLNYISEHFDENISLMTIADEFGYNYQYLSRAFNNAIGVNFKTLLNHYRYEYARQLLTETDKSIAEIVFESGFQSVRSFNRICLELSGHTPSEIRRK